MIELYFIRGINRLDTPYFSTINDRTVYYRNHLVTSIDGGYYPPHYQNTIKISTELTVLTQVNYLGLVYDSKTYYYFIDSIKYINEDIIELSITMDTIQTYMFDIDFINANIERMSIKRWLTVDNQDVINREYIRENFGTDLKKCLKYAVLNTFPVYIIKATAPVGDNETETDAYKKANSDNIKEFNSKGQAVTDVMYYYILFPPYRNGYSTTAEYWVDKGNAIYCYTDLIMHSLATNPNVVEIQYINNCTIDGLSYNGLGRYDIDSSKLRGYTANVCATTVVGSGHIYRIVGCKANDIINTAVFRCGRNKQINQPFDYNNIPQLIDENYYTIKYGERLGYTSYPLSKLTKDLLVFKYVCDIIGNNRVFTMTGNSLDDKDCYFTTITNNTKETYTLVMDNLKQYLLSNQGSLTSGVALAKQQNLYKTAMALTGSAMSFASSFANSKLLSMASIGGVGASVVNAIEKNYAIDQQIKVNKENAEYTPDTVKQGNSYSGDYFNNSLDIVQVVEEDTNIVNIAHRYESFGYKVDKFVSGENIFNTLNIRYYFNIIKLSSVELNLNILNDETTINNIKSRLVNGIRMFNVSTNIELGNTTQYDNVEKEVL